MTNETASESNHQPARQGYPPFWLYATKRVFDFADLHTGTLVTGGTLLGSVALVAWALRGFAGQATFATFLVQLSSHVQLSFRVSIALAGLSTLTNLLQLVMHKQTKRRMGNRIKKLEDRIDKSRESSDLDADYDIS